MRRSLERAEGLARQALALAREFENRRRNHAGHHFWARGYFVSTVGRDEDVIRRYIRSHEVEDQRQDQLKFS